MKLSRRHKILICILALLIIPLFYLALRGIIEIPAIIEIGSFDIRLYGVVLAAVMLLGIRLIESHVDYKYKKNVQPAFFWCIIPAILGARIWHIFTDFYLYQNNLVDIVAIWNGGLSIFGALAGGSLGLIFYLKRKQIPIIATFEIVAIFLPLLQSIGRFANFFNRELFGYPTQLPWGMYVNDENRPEGYEEFQYFHPTFLYESIGTLILFIIMYYLYKKRGISGDGFFIALYLLGYGIIRLIVNYFRIDTETVSQVSNFASIVMITLATIYIIIGQKQKWIK